MKKKIFFLVFSIAFLSLAYSVLTQGSGGGGMPAFGGGCWNFNTEQTCTNTSDEYGCRWNEFMGGGGTGPIGWCEEKGCWSYWNSNDCTAAGCSWDPQGFCYKKDVGIIQTQPLVKMQTVLGRVMVIVMKSIVGTSINNQLVCSLT